MGCAFVKERQVTAPSDSTATQESTYKQKDSPKIQNCIQNEEPQKEDIHEKDKEKEKEKTGKQDILATVSIKMSNLRFASKKYRRQPSEVPDSNYLSKVTIPTIETSRAVIAKKEDGTKSVNQYTFIKSIGAGAYGKVKLVFNTDDKNHYAMKILIKSQLMRKRVGMKKGSAFEDVLREIELMKKLDNAYIIKLVEVINDPMGDKIYMIIEYAEGGPSMKGEMEMDPLDEMQARKYFHDVVCGLEYLHSLKIIHRDIKPENILVMADGTAKISDFGVSICLETKEDQKALKKTVGSPIFLPPELCATELKSSKIIGTAIDIWCLGITLYFFISGKPPFVADTEMQLYENIRTKKLDFNSGPPSPSSSPNSLRSLPVNPQLQDLLRKLLHKDPKHRITIEEIKRHPWVQFDLLNKFDPVVTVQSKSNE